MIDHQINHVSSFKSRLSNHFPQQKPFHSCPWNFDSLAVWCALPPRLRLFWPPLLEQKSPLLGRSSTPTTFWTEGWPRNLWGSYCPLTIEQNTGKNQKHV